MLGSDGSSQWPSASGAGGAELLTGTFYLLVIGVALSCGGIAAWLGVSVPLRWLTAGVLGIVGTILLQRWKRQLAANAPPQQAAAILSIAEANAKAIRRSPRQSTASMP